LNKLKNPVLFDESPAPSDLYRYENPDPGVGVFSVIEVDVLIVDGTISNFLEIPLTDLSNVKTGKSTFDDLEEYT
tara:strand:+ start:539 stop:763 length:225 start_codon:yes stop_codon:yes gene_type:complete